MQRLLFIVCIFSLGFLSSCSKKTETFTPVATIEDYAPYEVGKYITYKLDSLVYINFGTKDTTISYEAKFVVDAKITDNLGRPAYRILYFLRKTSLGPWVPQNTFMAVKENHTLEFIENNFRYIKLKDPIYDGYTWKGNSYIDTESQDSKFKYLDDWDYIYDEVNTPLTLGNINLPYTLKVLQRDEVLGSPGNPNVFGEINFSEEKYAKGIGLVYRKFIHEEYQDNIHAFVEGSYGITLTMIDHN